MTKSSSMVVWGFLILFLPMVQAEAVQTRIALIVGNNIGSSTDIPLRFAQTDAQEMADLLTDLGRFDKSRIHLLLGKDKHVFDKSLEQIKGRIAEIKAHGDEALLLFYFSGHGSHGALHLGETRIKLAELRDTLQTTGSAIVIGIIDACHSGRIGQAKGGYPDRAFDITLYDQSTPMGTVLISSALADELAQESLDIGGSLFTHYFMSALRGEADYDLDGRITLQEAYSSAYHHTLKASVTTSDKRQHPLADIDLTGKGELVITYLQKSSASISFSDGTSGCYMIIQNQKNKVMAEVSKDVGRPVRVVLPPGKYQVYKQEQNDYLVKEINLAWGGEYVLDEAVMSRIPYRDFLAKSSGERQTKNTVSIQGDILQAQFEGMRNILAYGLGYERFVGRRLSLGVSFVYSQQSFEPGTSTTSTVRIEELRSSVLIDHHFAPLTKFPFLSCFGGIDLEYVTGSAKQTFSRFPANTNQKDFQSLGFGPEAGIVLELPGSWKTSLRFRELIAWTNIPWYSCLDEGEYYSPIIASDTHQNVLLWNICFTVSYEF